jgi:protein-disulfide isomerase
LVAVLALVQPRPPAPSAPNLAATAFGALVALSVPLFWSPPQTQDEPEETLASGLPEVLAAEQRPGVITVVEFLDPDCDACRTYDSFLREWQARAGDKIRVVRKLVPREERAQAAARALCCAEQLGAGDAMAEALLSGPLPAPSEVEGLAASLNLDPILYRGCVDSPASGEQVARDVESASALGVVSLPTIWVGGERVDGHRAPEELQTCLERALGAL